MQPASYVTRLIRRTLRFVCTSLEIFNSSAKAKGAPSLDLFRNQLEINITLPAASSVV